MSEFKCLENGCNLFFEKKIKLTNHIKYFHKMTIEQYREKHNLNKYCKHDNCGTRIPDDNQSGFCNKHRDRSGNKNPFYGKKHSKETIEKAKIKNRQASINKWKEKEYREKVIKGTSKPRKESFKKEQSERVKLWYENNPDQKILRSQQMHESWINGKIVVNNKNKYSTSKIEIDFFNELKKRYPFIEKKTIFLKNKKRMMPDVLILDSYIIIEFFGDYWHANPKFYKSTDMIRTNSAETIWKGDEERINMIKEEGFNVYIVWQSDYINKKEEILNDFDILLNWGECFD